MNYGRQVLQLGVMLMQLNDTEREGDGDRSLINWKMLMLYFRCSSRGTKYGYEAMRLITHLKALYTEKMAHRVLHGQFINGKGGPGNNCANDLKMEHLVRQNKAILKGLCVNKTYKAVERCSKAAYGIRNVVAQYDAETNISPASSSHTHASSTEDVKEMINIVHKEKPFTPLPGRKLTSFTNIPKTPLEKLNLPLLHKWLTRHKKNLFKGVIYEQEEDGSDDEEGTEDEDEIDDGDDDIDLLLAM